MKRILLFLLLTISIYGNMAADGTTAAQINLQHKKHGGPRADDPVVEPEAFIDYFEHVIIIDGGDDVSYYEVEITSTINGYYELFTLVNGTYDTFDVSSLSAGSHTISITSPFGDVYEGTFTTY
ncbi:MAG: hypothetical protein IKH25_03815 [Muribaculaceae bacterium]|nr:hypothetical protein [Muribaculaceae bacterium]